MATSTTHWIQAHVWLIAVTAIAAFTMFTRLDTTPIQNWDEGIHGEVSFEMVEGGDWLTPHYAGGTYFRKPPLKLWLSAILFTKFGVNAWTLRLPNALAGIATAVLVAWWVWEWRRSHLEAFLAGLITATMRPIFFHAFRTGEMDGMLTFFVVAALYCWWRATLYAPHTQDKIPNAKIQIPNKSQISKFQTTKWLAACGVAIGLGIMTKSAAGLLPIPIIAADYILHRRWRAIRLRSMLVPGIWCLVIVTPWHLAMTILHGRAFWSDYIGWHVIKRITEVMHNPNAGFWWYIPTFMRRFTPYTWWFAPAIVYAMAGLKSTRMDERKNGIETNTSLLTWFLIGFALFTFAKTKFDWYLLPLYPAAVMLVVPFLASAREIPTSRVFAILHLVALAAFALALPKLFPTGTITNRITEQWVAAFGHPIVFATAVVCTIAGIVAIAHRRWGSTVAGRVAQVIVIVVVMVPAFTVTARHLLAREPAHPAIALAANLRNTGGILVSYGMDFKQAPAAYFILRSTLTNNVRILDGLTNVKRTLGMLAEKNRPGSLITRGDALSPELAAVVDDPQQFGEFTLWHRR